MNHTRAGALIAGSLVLLAAAITLKGWNDGPWQSPNGASFVVTSSQDAGPGSLRDAIIAADRSPSHARIAIRVARIGIESALPALANLRGIDIDAGANEGLIDAEREASGATLQINGPGSSVRGLHIVNAHGIGILVNAPGTVLESLSVSGSKVGVLLGTAARGSILRGSSFEADETALTSDGAIRAVEVSGSTFRANTRAAVWLVGAADPKAAGASSLRAAIRITDSVFEKNISGVVLANRPLVVQKSRFLDCRDSAILILGGAALIEDNEIRGSGGSALSVTAGRGVALVHNTLIDNPATAIMLRDSDVSVERNTLRHNGLGIVSMVGNDGPSPVIRGNLITQSSADALTLIGGTAEVAGNRIMNNQGAGLRTLNLVLDHDELKVDPRLDANVLSGNGIDAPPPGVYRLAGAL
jgi:Right handed beta helix region